MWVREMRAEDRPAVLDLLEHAFRLRELFERYMDFDPAFAHRDFLLAVDGDRPVACVQVFAKTIRLREGEARLGGIGSVATHADYRGRGLSSELLVATIERMRARGMALSLLFAGPAQPLYARHGWRRIPLPLIRLRAPAAARPTPAGRLFQPDDLPRVRALYDDYSGHLAGTTVRDERYWRGQLRTAGTPEEDFRVAERRGRIAAYSRAANFAGRTRVLEYAREPDAAGALADLLSAQAGAPDALPIPDAHDAELARALESRGFLLSNVPDVSAMWRELLPGALSQIETASVTYWPSDRF